jgi:hypothetical protein
MLSSPVRVSGIDGSARPAFGAIGRHDIGRRDNTCRLAAHLAKSTGIMG